MKNVVIALLVVGVALFWVTGKKQPIAVVTIACESCGGTGLVACPKCKGAGSSGASSACPKCGGTGKGQWAFRTANDKPISKSQPMCIACKGTGASQTQSNCANCGGKGKIPCAKCSAGGGKNRPGRIVKAELSKWEKALQILNVKPDPNSRPQRMSDGSYPLILKYIEIFTAPEREARVVKWSPARQEGTEWLVGALIECRDPDGKLVRQEWEFAVENRAVKGCRKLARGER